MTYIAANQNKSFHQQESDKLVNDCRLGMFIEELRACLERCNVKWWMHSC